MVILIGLVSAPRLCGAGGGSFLIGVTESGIVISRLATVLFL